MHDLAMFRLHRTTPTERLEKTIKPFVSNAPEVLALAKTLGLTLCGIEYIDPLNSKYGQTKRNLR